MPQPIVGSTRHKLFALIASLALIAAACGSSDASQESTNTTSPPAQEAAVDEDVAGPEETTTTEPAPVVAPLEFGGPIEPGRYTTDLLGTELELDLDESWIPAVGDPGGFIIEGSNKLGDFTEGVLFTRMSSFAGPADLDDPNPPGPHLSGSPADFDAWLSASGELIVDSDQTVSVGGLDAREVQIRVDPDGAITFPGGCGPGPDDRCFFVGGTLSDTLFFYIVRTTEVYRMWLVPQPGFDEPVLITAIAAEGNEQFLDQAGELVASLAFGDPQAHPVELPDGPPWEAGLASTIPAGVSTVPALGGLQFEMLDDRFVFQEQNFVRFDSNADADGLFPPSAFVALVHQFANGEIVDGVNGFVNALDSYGTLTLSGDRIDLLGSTLVGYEFVDGTDPEVLPPVAFSSAPAGGASNYAWAPNPFATLYLADTPDGVLVIGYDGFSLLEQLLGKAVFDEVVPTLISLEDASSRIPPGAS